MNRLLLLDGNAILHRAYHALPPLTNTAGKQVHAVYGFASMLMRLEQDLHPYAIVSVFDRPVPTFRKKLYDNYQKNRPKMDDSLAQQIPLVHDLVAAFGIPFYEKDGFEADDVIGTIVKTVSSAEFQTEDGKSIDQIIIVTGDRDLLQLVVDEKVLVYMPTKGISQAKLYGEKEVIDRMGVTPKQIIDLKALIGDSSDNYPGVSGIGPKTALALLEKNGTLEHIYAALKSNKLVVRSSVIEKLALGEEAAFLSQNLAAIRNDVPISFTVSQMADIKSRKEAQIFLDTMQFHSLLTRLQGRKKDDHPPKKKKNEQIQSTSQQQSLF